MCLKAIKEVLGEEMDSFAYYTEGLFDSAAQKLCGMVFILFGFHVAGIHGDVTILSLLIKLMVADFLLGVLCAIKTKTWNYQVLVRGICKFPLYALYIFLVACVDQLVYKYTGLQDGWCVRLFLAYLLVCEIYSIIRTLGKMGVKVPMLLVYLSNRLKEVFERKGKAGIDKMMNNKENKETEHEQGALGNNSDNHTVADNSPMDGIRREGRRTDLHE